MVIQGIELKIHFLSTSKYCRQLALRLTLCLRYFQLETRDAVKYLDKRSHMLDSFTMTIAQRLA
jgi:hypothetical protein